MGRRHRPACCAALVAPGCGAGAAEGDAADVRATVSTVLSQCAAGRGPEVLHILNVPARRTFIAAGGTLEGCNAVFRLAPELEGPVLADVFRRAEVTTVRVDGGFADVRVTAAGGRRARVEAEDLGDEWRVTNAPLP